MNRALAVTVTIALSCHIANARTARDRHARDAFAAEHPCPDLGSYGVCADVVDHVIPLCSQPAFPAVVLDTPANMAWEAADEAEVKDRYERRLCHALDRAARLQLGPDAYRAAFATYWRSVATPNNATLRARAEAEPRRAGGEQRRRVPNSLVPLLRRRSGRFVLQIPQNLRLMDCRRLRRSRRGFMRFARWVAS